MSLTSDAPTSVSASPDPGRSPARLDALDGLRGLAALGIVVLHVWMFDRGDAGRNRPGAETTFDLAMNELRLGVVLFFVLSGYLLYRPFVSAALEPGTRFPRLGPYVVRRAARILPAYWATIVGAYLILGVIDHPARPEFGQLWIFAVFGQNQVEETAKMLDPPMWSLAVEASFYVLLPIVGWLALRAGASRARQLWLIALLMAGGVGYTAFAVLGDVPWTVTASLPMHVTEFGMGMAAAVLLHGRRIGARAACALIAGGVAVAGANAWWHAAVADPMLADRIVRDLPAAFGFALMVGALAASPLKARLLTNWPVRWLGQLSYPIYLWHYIAIYWLRGRDEWPEHLALAFVWTMALTLPVSLLSWYALERPAINWARRRTRKVLPERVPAVPSHQPARRPAPAHGRRERWEPARASSRG